jgi:8-oxo-dGTP pyrophosphatase MutT (NUDIX family)
MLKKIYFNNKPLFLIDQVTKEIEEYLHHDDTVFIDEFNVHSVKTMIYEMQLPGIHAGVFLHENLDTLFNAFKKKFKLVMAAGGFVHTDNEVLLIFRRHKWDLPKGKVDEHEDLATCAIREVKEETGLNSIKLQDPLCVTYHTYHERSEYILKESHWYLIKGNKHEAFVPQLDEDIEKCEWVPIDKLAPYMENTFPSILDVVNAGVKALHQTKNI